MVMSSCEEYYLFAQKASNTSDTIVLIYTLKIIKKVEEEEETQQNKQENYCRKRFYSQTSSRKRKKSKIHVFWRYCLTAIHFTDVQQHFFTGREPVWSIKIGTNVEKGPCSVQYSKKVLNALNRQSNSWRRKSHIVLSVIHITSYPNVTAPCRHPTSPPPILSKMLTNKTVLYGVRISSIE